MIIWLASYPKSGNTWLRTIIGQLFSDNFNKKNIFEKSKKIRVYPSKVDFEDLDEIFKLSKFSTEDKKKILEKTIINWSSSQSKINLDNKIKIFKTHNMLCKLNVKDKPYSFTNIENTIGVIHIVRDPRNIITSLKNHFSFENDGQAIKFMTNDNSTIGLDENKIPQFLSSWNNHYNSWKRFPKNYILIRYEDLILDTKKEIKKLIDYLNNFFDFTVLNTDLERMINNSSFNNLKELERKGLFSENAINVKTGEVKSFFNLGHNNDWKKILEDETKKIIEKNFQKEMQELKYL